MDIWRHLYGNRRIYSCFSQSYGSMSRIDLAFASRDLCHQILKMKYEPHGISDHSPVLISLREVDSPASGRTFKLNSHWLHVIGEQGQIDHEIQEFWGINVGSTHIHYVWDALKAHIRGIYFSKINRYRVELRQREQQLTETIRRLQGVSTAHHNEQNITQLKEANAQFKILLYSKAQHKLLFQGQNRFCESGGAASYLVHHSGEVMFEYHSTCRKSKVVAVSPKLWLKFFVFPTIPVF